MRISVPYEEAVDKCKASVVILRKDTYIKKVQSQIYGHIKECVDQEQILLLVDYEESCKKVQQNETQSV